MLVVSTTWSTDNRRGKTHIEDERRDPTYKLIFAICENEPVGFIEARMEDAETGFIRPCRPCVLPTFQQCDLHTRLVEISIKHLQNNGAKTAEFSIVGSANDVTPYLDPYQKIGFGVWRQAKIMQKKSYHVTNPKTDLPLSVCHPQGMQGW